MPLKLKERGARMENPNRPHPIEVTFCLSFRDRSFFMREGGLVGFGKPHLKIA